MGHSITQILLSSQRTTEDYKLYETNTSFYFMVKAILSTSPSKTSNYIVMMIHSDERSIGFSKSRDKTWTRMELSVHVQYTYVIHYNGKFYVVLALLVDVFEFFMFYLARSNPTRLFRYM